MKRGEIWWAELPDPTRSEPGYKRPVLIVQADAFNKSRIRTVIAAALTKNLNLAQAPGNVLVSPKQSGLTQKSVINVSQLVTLDKSFLTERVRALPPSTLAKVEQGLRLVLCL